MVHRCQYQSFGFRSSVVCCARFFLHICCFVLLLFYYSVRARLFYPHVKSARYGTGGGGEKCSLKTYCCTTKNIYRADYLQTAARPWEAPLACGRCSARYPLARQHVALPGKPCLLAFIILRELLHYGICSITQALFFKILSLLVYHRVKKTRLI